MKETLIDIATHIDSCAKARKGTGIAPFARVHCLFDGKEDNYWFTSNYYSGFDLNELKKYGHFVPKNSRIAIKMQTYEVGSSFEYEQMNNIRRMQKHHVVLENRADLQNQTIAIAGDTILYQFRNIREFLEALRQNREDIIEVEGRIAELKQEIEALKKQKDTAHQRGQITKTINAFLKEYRILTQQQEDLKNITIYIRKQGEMRYSPIVDTIQTRIKSQNLFDGTTVIINGGPGTGKSTTMIHRLAYLTDTFAIEEDMRNESPSYKLSRSQRKQLLDAVDAQRDWMFFSPSQMLKEYLAEAMRKEGLKNTSMKVWNWKDYCRLLLQADYGLIGADGINAPFKVYNTDETLFLQGYDIINEFLNFYTGQFQAIKSQLPQISEEGKVFAWTAIAKGIEKKFEGSETFSLTRFISLFNSLESVYANDCRSLLREKNAAIEELAEEICRILENDLQTKEEVIDMLFLTEDSKELEEEPQEDITSAEDEKNKEEKLKKELQKWLKAFCHSKMDNKSKLSNEYSLINEILLPVLSDKYDGNIQKIGELIIFEEFAQYTRGVKAIMLNGIPARYKKFRAHLLSTKYDGCNLKLLRDIMQSRQGKGLHQQEQSLLLGFINTLVKQISASAGTNIKHPYIEAYEKAARPIIGIDEATDFSACDIYAMQSLLSRDFSSLTLCGDMMQRLTSYGIKSWSELDGIVPNPSVVEMKTSYRQSMRLLEVARQLYIDTLGEIPNYKAFMKSSKVPAPLVYVNGDEHSRIQWISKRISEVFRAYGEQLPSIAIFVNDKGYIPKFVDNLQNTEFFSKNGVKVLDGTSANTKNVENHICVYPIEVVKGMEFDVVFFHNIDNSSEDMEILKRYIYVGVSRAAFFLGITMSEQNPAICRYFEQGRDWFKI